MPKPLKVKREEAEARAAEWAKLSPMQQLMSLNRRGLNAAKQRAKIAKLLKEKQA